MKKYLFPLLMLLTGHAAALNAQDGSATSDNTIYISDLTAKAGDELDLSICMRNTAAIRGFQFDLCLPNGVTAVKSNKGKYQASLTEARLPEDDEHTLTLAEQEDGSLRFLCGSLYNETFTGTDGEIATLKVWIAEDMQAGDHVIALKNIKLTETDISNYYETALTETILTIGSGTTDGVGATLMNSEKVNSEVYDLQGRRVKASMLNNQSSMLKSGLYISNGKKVVVR